MIGKTLIEEAFMKQKITKILLLLIMLVTMITPVYAASNNKYLKELEVENHKIYFGKERTNYSIVLNEGENSVKINAVAEDSKAKVDIKGADDLKANNYRIVVKVTAENNSTMEYIIEAHEKEEIIEEKKETIFDQIEKFFKDLNIDMTIVYIVIGALAVIIVIIIIVSKVRDRKMEKTMDKF